MEPAKRSSNEPLPEAKHARGNPNYFANPQTVTSDKLLITAQNALEQLKAGDRPLHKEIIQAVRVWSGTCVAFESRMYHKLFPICRQILQLENSLPKNPEKDPTDKPKPIVSIGFDLSKFPLTETQLELMNMSSMTINKELNLQSKVKPGQPLLIELDKLVEQEAAARGFKFELEIDDLEVLILYLEKGRLPNQENYRYAILASLLRMPSFIVDLSVPRSRFIQNLNDINELIATFERLIPTSLDGFSKDVEIYQLQFVLLNPRVLIDFKESGLYYLLGPNKIPILNQPNSTLSLLADLLHSIQTNQIDEGFRQFENLSPAFQNSNAGRMILFRLQALNEQYEESDRLIDNLHNNLKHLGNDQELNQQRLIREQRLAYYLERVKMLRQVNQHQAGKIISKILKEYPDNSNFLLQKAKIMSNREKDVQDIIKVLEKIFETEPSHLKARLFYAEMLLLAKRPQDALANLNKLMTHNFKPYKVYRLRGEVWDQLKRYNEAISDYLHLSKIEPHSHESYSLAASMYFKMENYPATVKNIKLAEQIWGDITEETMELRLKLPPEFIAQLDSADFEADIQDDENSNN